MNNKSILIFIILIFNILVSQNYALRECIGIAIIEKKTLLSSQLAVSYATKGLQASYSGLLPTIQASSSVGKTYFPETENISFNFEDLKLDTTLINNYNTV